LFYTRLRRERGVSKKDQMMFPEDEDDLFGEQIEEFD